MLEYKTDDQNKFECELRHLFRNAITHKRRILRNFVRIVLLELSGLYNLQLKEFIEVNKLLIRKIAKRIKYKVYPVTYPVIYPFIRLKRGGRMLEVPTSFLYSQISNIDEVESVTEAWLNFKQKREDIPIVNFKEHHDFIQFCIDPTKGSVDEYLDRWEYSYTSRNLVPPCPREEFLERRRKFIGWAIKKGPRKALNRHPSQVERFERDHFNLYDGHHRVVLADFCRIDYLKVECPPDIYKRFVKRRTPEIVKLVEGRIKNNGKFYQPIDIPGYYGINVVRNCKRRLDIIRRWLGGDLKGCSTLLDIGSKLGYFCHHLERQGVKTFGIEPDLHHIEIALALNRAYGLNSRFEQVGLEHLTTDKAYDIVLAFTVMYHIVKMKLLTHHEVADKLGRLTRKYLFWESGLHREREKENILRVGNFREYLKLANSYATGKLREIGVFIK